MSGSNVMQYENGKFIGSAVVFLVRQWRADWYRPDYFGQSAVSGAAHNPQGPSDSCDPQEPGIPKRAQKSGSFLRSDEYCSRHLVGSRDKGLLTVAA
jgi:formylglycine-generating enzyme